MAKQAAAPNDVVVKMGVEFSAIVLCHETHESRIPQTASPTSGHTHADGRTVKEVFQHAEHANKMQECVRCLQGIIQG